jgi:Helix-turn-helix domain of resolvase
VPRVYSRRFDWEEAERLREDGQSVAAIARQFGVTPEAVALATDPSRRARARERKRRWAIGRASCVDCGGPVYPRADAHRCAACAARAAAKVREGEAWCPDCGEWRPLGDFRSANNARGVVHYCRAHETARRKAWRDRNRERQRLYERERYKRRREAGRAAA